MKLTEIYLQKKLKLWILYHLDLGWTWIQLCWFLTVSSVGPWMFSPLPILLWQPSQWMPRWAPPPCNTQTLISCVHVWAYGHVFLFLCWQIPLETSLKRTIALCEDFFTASHRFKIFFERSDYVLESGLHKLLLKVRVRYLSNPYDSMPWNSLSVSVLIDKIDRYQSMYVCIYLEASSCVFCRSKTTYRK